MKKINLEKDDIFTGSYDADKNQWDIYVNGNTKEIPTELMLSQDGDDYWNCYLVKAIYSPKHNHYELKYKEY